MAELTSYEATLLGIVRRESGGGQSVTARRIWVHAQVLMGNATMWIGLSSLVSKGLLSKPSRGHYLPTEENA